MYDLHRLGWSSFQQLCLTISREVLGQTVQSFLDSNDAGRDGAFAGTWTSRKNESLSGKFVIQCKFSSKAGASLTSSAMADEVPKVRKLVAEGLCDVYVLLTNAGISANQEMKITAALQLAGVKHVVVFGSNWIEAQIRENTRLRMLVPRVYGLGDLSQILDERAYAQARAVLETLREDLAKVVITDSYRRAVSALDDHGFVLLIGEPAAGKTTIAAMLAMSAADKWKSSVLKLSDPAKIVERWNVDEPSQFFWIDDAFGVTQYESPLVHGWNHSLAQVKAILRQGGKIVMTSRDYIYNRARRDLKESVFPLLSESQVVIDVHELSDLEKQQILYNHLRLGRQPASFLASIKAYLEYVAAHPRFIPETARRIADPLFTKDIYMSEYHLGHFVDKREQLLLEIIQGLDLDSKAALGLIYMRKDFLESPIALQATEQQAIERLGSTLGGCINALDALKGSLVSQMHVDDQSVWRFKHPTIGDAYAATLAFSPDLMGIFLSGSSAESLVSQVTCGNVGIEKAVIVPKNLFLLMIDRLRDFSSSEKYKVEWLSSWSARQTLCRFLARRCSKEFLALFIEQDPSILNRVSKPGLSLGFSSEVDLAVRLHEFDLLPEENRKLFIDTVSSYAIEGEDALALEDSGMRTIFTDQEFEGLVESVRMQLLPKLGSVRRKMQHSYDSSTSPDEHMQSLFELLETLKKSFVNDDVVSKTIDQEIERANQWITETEPPEAEISPRVMGDIGASAGKHGTRSIFDDVDAEED
ncbi:nSTAND3 domain-containing NTPase [Stutzerimonas nitrititolerans]